jgi:hypothetical protein
VSKGWASKAPSRPKTSQPAPPDVSPGTNDQSLIKYDPLIAAAAFARLTFARRIHQDAPHEAGRDGEKVRAVLPGDLSRVNKAQVGFIDKRRGLQGVPGALLPHKTSGNPAQFGVDERDQPFQRRRIACAPSQ